VWPTTSTTCLMIVLGQVELSEAQRSVRNPEPIQGRLGAIELAVQRGASLTRQLLTFARRPRPGQHHGL